MTQERTSPAINAGHIGMTRGKTLVDRVIQIGTVSRYNHIAVSVQDERRDGKIMVVEASPHGAQHHLVSADRFVWDSVRLSNAQRRTVVEAALECVGLPYDWRDIARFIVLHRIGRIRGWTKDHPDTHVICSEIGAWALCKADAYPFGDIAPGDVSPGDLADWAFRNDERRPKDWR